MSDECGLESQDRAAREEYLTTDEREALEGLCTQSDGADHTILREAAAGAGSYSVRPACRLRTVVWRPPPSVT
jgi:hypothetical protein